MKRSAISGAGFFVMKKKSSLKSTVESYRKSLKNLKSGVEYSLKGLL